MLRRYHVFLPLVLLLFPLPIQSENATCPYDLASVLSMIPPACYANASSTASPLTTCCWYVFAAYFLAATRYANLTGVAFLPSPAAVACYASYSKTLLSRGLVRPALLSDSSCDLSTSSLAQNGGACRFPTVAAVRSAVDLKNATHLCAAPGAGDLDPDDDRTACPDCREAVISATFSLLDVTQSKEYVPCGMAATIGIWALFFPSLPRFRSYALCMLQVFQNIGGLGTSNLVPSPPPPPAKNPPALSASSPSRSKTIKIATASAAAGLFSMAAIVFLAFKIRHAAVISYDRATDDRATDSSDPKQVNFTASPLPTEGLYIFTKAEIKTATNGYDDRLLLGEGGAGKVYLGRLPSGKHVAIKRFYREKKLAEFYSEVAILAKLRHRNLATLIGYCLGGETDHHALAYEYMAGGNLASALFSGGDLPWLRRLSIAADIAEGLAYLHGFPEGAVVHRDVKPTNVLLTEDLGVAKLSDFGVSRIVPADETHLSTEMMGTMGYVDPESFAIGHVSEATDAYSFGVVLLQLITGMQAVVQTPTGGAESIVHSTRKAAAAVAEGAGEGATLAAVVDPRLGERWDQRTAGLVFELACRCIGPSKNERPRMVEVAAMLRGALADLETRSALPSSSSSSSTMTSYSSSLSSDRKASAASMRSPEGLSSLWPPALQLSSAERWTS